jgi:hypothetical protein
MPHDQIFALAGDAVGEGSGEGEMRIFGRFFDRIHRLVVSNSGSEEAAVMESQDDREFAAIIAAIAERRKVDRSTAITVTPLFQPMLDRLSLTELKNYVFTRYPNRRGEDQFTKYDLVEIGEQELKSFNRAFLHKDMLRIVFSYSDAWETVDRFHAILLNDKLWFY